MRCLCAELECQEAHWLNQAILTCFMNVRQRWPNYRQQVAAEHGPAPSRLILSAVSGGDGLHQAMLRPGGHQSARRWRKGRDTRVVHWRGGCRLQLGGFAFGRVEGDCTPRSQVEFDDVQAIESMDEAVGVRTPGTWGQFSWRSRTHRKLGWGLGLERDGRFG